MVTAFLNPNDTLVRFDFVAPGEDNARTYTTFRFFDIIPGPINATLFDNPCL